MGLMAKWKELSDIGIPISTPSPEAIVRAALERVVSLCRAIADGCGNTEGSEAWAFDEAAHQISVLASNPAEVAAIIKAAGEDQTND
jgi:hypothetical protein